MRIFTLSDEQVSKALHWEITHNCTIVYAGAAGGKITYQFTPNSIGMVEKVVCVCGEEVDMTDYSEW